jgi:hypothetical protein
MTFVFTTIDMRNSNFTVATPPPQKKLGGGKIFLLSPKDKASYITGSYLKLGWAVAFVTLITESSRLVRCVATHVYTKIHAPPDFSRTTSILTGVGNSRAAFFFPI